MSTMSAKSAKEAQRRGFTIEDPTIPSKTSSAAGRTWETLDTVLMCIPIVGWIILAIRWFGSSEDLADKVNKETSCPSKSKTQEVATTTNIFSYNPKVSKATGVPATNTAPVITAPSAPPVVTVKKKAGTPTTSKPVTPKTSPEPSPKRGRSPVRTSPVSSTASSLPSDTSSQKYLTPAEAVKIHGVKGAAFKQNFYFADVDAGKISLKDTTTKKTEWKNWAKGESEKTTTYDRETLNTLKALISTLT